MVQRRDGRERAEPDVHIQELIGDAAAHRVVIGREERGARGGHTTRAHCSSHRCALRWAAPDTSDGRSNWDSLWLSSHRGSVSH